MDDAFRESADSNEALATPLAAGVLGGAVAGAAGLFALALLLRRRRFQAQELLAAVIEFPRPGQA